MNEKKELLSAIAIRVCDRILGPIEREGAYDHGPQIWETHGNTPMFRQLGLWDKDSVKMPPERDRTTLDALEVARVRGTQGADRQRLDEIKKQMAPIWHDQASEAEADVVFDTGVESDDDAYFAVWNTKRLAFAEIERRVLYGQKIDDDTLDKLLTALVWRLAGVSEGLLDVTTAMML